MFRARFATSPSDVIEKLNLNLRDIEAELARRPQAGPAATKPQTLPIPSPSAVRHDATAGIDEGDIKHMTAAWVSGLTGGVSTALHSHSQYMLAAMRGAVNGVCELDANSLIPIGRVPASLLGGVRYQGVWNATTNTPTLATSPDSTTKGFYYKVSVAGTWNSISWAIGDWIISSGTSWDKVDNTDQVTSVFGRQGAITALAGDYTAAQVGAEPAVTAGLVSQFWSGLKTWRDLAADVRAVVLTGLSTATNSAITATDSVLTSLGKLQAQINARPAITVDAIPTDGSANAVSSNGVFDALAGKEDGYPTYTWNNNSPSTYWWNCLIFAVSRASDSTQVQGGLFQFYTFGGTSAAAGSMCEVLIELKSQNGNVSYTAQMTKGTSTSQVRISYFVSGDGYNYLHVIPYVYDYSYTELRVVKNNGYYAINPAGAVTSDYTQVLYPNAPTAPAGSNNTEVATTAWVRGYRCSNLAGSFTTDATNVSITPNLYYRIYTGVDITLANGGAQNGDEIVFVGYGCSGGSSSVNGIIFSWPTRYLSFRFFDGAWLAQHPA